MERPLATERADRLGRLQLELQFELLLELELELELES